jgi:hypothetical protein
MVGGASLSVTEQVDESALCFARVAIRESGFVCAGLVTLADNPSGFGIRYTWPQADALGCIFIGKALLSRYKFRGGLSDRLRAV